MAKRSKSSEVTWSGHIHIDVLLNILVRVDPSSIINCIQVCKEWHEAITNPGFREAFFRQRFGKNLKTQLVGFLKHTDGSEIFMSDDITDGSGCDLLATSQLGLTISERMSSFPEGYFICKSGAGDGLVLSGVSSESLYVSSRPPRRLPQPPNLFDAVAIMREEDPNSYKVLGVYRDPDLPAIYTFSSSTGMWERSPVTFSGSGCFTKEPGIVDRKGVVYWKGTCLDDQRYITGCLAVYNPTCVKKCINFIRGPEYDPPCQQHYGVSSQGFIQCAKWKGVNNNPAICKIWALDDYGKDWSLLYTVDFDQLMSPGTTDDFDFLSFVPWRSDSIFLRSRDLIFLYQFDTRVLQRFGQFLEKFPTQNPYMDSIYYSDLIPLTLLDLGVWSSLRLHRNFLYNEHIHDGYKRGDMYNR